MDEAERGRPWRSPSGGQGGGVLQEASSFGCQMDGNIYGRDYGAAVIALAAIPVIFDGRWVEAGRRHVESEFNAFVQGERLAGIYQDLFS